MTKPCLAAHTRLGHCKEVPLPARERGNIAQSGALFPTVAHPSSRPCLSANSSLTIRRFWGKKGKRGAEKGQSERRETPFLSLLILPLSHLKSPLPSSSSSTLRKAWYSGYANARWLSLRCSRPTHFSNHLYSSMQNRRFRASAMQTSADDSDSACKKWCNFSSGSKYFSFAWRFLKLGSVFFLFLWKKYFEKWSILIKN